MWKLAATGGGLLIAGAVKFAAHLGRAPTLEDYLTFRCGSSELAQLQGAVDHALWNSAHCWGCYAMALGAALLILAQFNMLARRRPPAGRLR